MTDGPSNRSRVLSRRTARYSGVAAVIVALVSILGATALAPNFDWLGSALSDMGTVPASAWLFNGGLVVGGLLGIPYAWMLWTVAADALSRLRAGCFLAAVLCLAGIGLFPSGTALHFPAAVGFYLAATLTMLVDGAARVRLGRGKLAAAFGAGTIGVWPVWLVWLPLGSGIAVPEFVGAVLFGLWVVALSPERPRASE